MQQTIAEQKKKLPILTCDKLLCSIKYNFNSLIFNKYLKLHLSQH